MHGMHEDKSFVDIAPSARTCARARATTRRFTWRAAEFSFSRAFSFSHDRVSLTTGFNVQEEKIEKKKKTYRQASERAGRIN